MTIGFITPDNFLLYKLDKLYETVTTFYQNPQRGAG